MQTPLTRALVVDAARAWIGTPYHHQASLRGVGTDCLGLVRGIWRDVYGVDAEQPPAYTRDWAEAASCETMLEAAARHLEAIAALDVEPGDVVIFRLRTGAVAKHAAIVATGTTMIHAMEGASVSEVPLSNWWRRRIAGAFRFPPVHPPVKGRGEVGGRAIFTGPTPISQPNSNGPALILST